MLKRLLLLLLLLAPVPACAAKPTLTIPSGLIILPNVATALTGISIAEAGAPPTRTYTTTLVAANAILTASGTNVSGSGTSSLSIGPDTTAQTATALATLQVQIAVSQLYQDDIIVGNVIDQLGVSAVAGASCAGVDGTSAGCIGIVADGNSYLTFSTLAAANTRSQQQCTALGCSGGTSLWWNVVPIASPVGGGAVQIAAGDPCFDSAVVRPNAVSTLSALSWSGGVVSATTSNPHGLPIGRPVGVAVRNAVPGGYNGGFQATPTGTSTFTYPLAANPGTATFTGNWASTCSNLATLHATQGLTGAEISALLTAPNAGFATPTVDSGGSVIE